MRVPREHRGAGFLEVNAKNSDRFRGSRIPRMSIDGRRLYGTAFRTLGKFERRVREISELSDRATSPARDGLTGGALRPRTDR